MRGTPAESKMILHFHPGVRDLNVGRKICDLKPRRESEPKAEFRGEISTCAWHNTLFK
jgi:hypothetical protein